MRVSGSVGVRVAGWMKEMKMNGQIHEERCTDIERNERSETDNEERALEIKREKQR